MSADEHASRSGRNERKGVAFIQVLACLTTIASNYLLTNPRLGLVRFTNTAIADTHPVYALPAGYAFAIWGLIFLLLGLFTAYQATLGLHSAPIVRLRFSVVVVELANVSWLFAFGYEQYWTASILIAAYTISLHRILGLASVDYLSRAHTSAHKLCIAAPFSVHASWVTLASALQIQVNLLEEGWLPSASFSSACLLLPVALACARAYQRVDVPYALVSVWGLYGIVVQQGAGSTFGCASRICPACQQRGPGGSILAICNRSDTSSFPGRPNGFDSLLCDIFDPSSPDQCPVAKSSEVAAWAWLGIAAVLLALLVGVVRALLHEEGVDKHGGAEGGLVEPLTAEGCESSTSNAGSRDGFVT